MMSNAFAWIGMQRRYIYLQIVAEQDLEGYSKQSGGKT